MSASCVSMPTRVPRISEMVPSSGSICPAMRRKSVDLPEPLTPIKPMRAPCWSVSDMSFRTDFMPKDFDTPCTVISIMRFPLCVYAPSQRPVAPQGSTPPPVTGSNDLLRRHLAAAVAGDGHGQHVVEHRRLQAGGVAV